MSLAIVIKAPHPTENCFIVMPFAPEFSNVYADILQAIAPHHLKPTRTDIMQPGINFIEDIVKITRSAKIIIAVCSPEPATGKANPNVMYELGMAHALGKPTIILTTSPNELPADLRDKYALPYDASKIGTQESVQNIKSGLDNLFRRLVREHANPLTDPGYNDISVVPQRYLMLLDQDFWSNFLIILAFGKHIRAEIQAVYANYITSLRKAVKDLNPNELSSINAFNEAWEYYNNFFESIMRLHVFDKLSLKQKQVKNSFAFLVRRTDQTVQEQVNNSRGFYEITNNLLEAYLGSHRSIKECLEGDALPLPLREDVKQKVYTHVNKLYDNAKNITLQTDTLIVNLIEIIQRIGD